MPTTVLAACQLGKLQPLTVSNTQKAWTRVKPAPGYFSSIALNNLTKFHLLNPGKMRPPVLLNWLHIRCRTAAANRKGHKKSGHPGMPAHRHS
jgi:hypothetical protein